MTESCGREAIAAGVCASTDALKRSEIRPELYLECVTSRLTPTSRLEQLSGVMCHPNQRLLSWSQWRECQRRECQRRRGPVLPTALLQAGLQGLQSEEKSCFTWEDVGAGQLHASRLIEPPYPQHSILQKIGIYFPLM